MLGSLDCLYLAAVLFTIICQLTCIAAVDVDPQKETYLPDYRYYHNLTALEQRITDLASKFKDVIHFDQTYKSRGGLSQLVIRVTNFSVPFMMNSDSHAFSPHDDLDKILQNKGSARLRVLLSFGEHAREFFPVESALFLLQNLTEGVNAKPDSYEEKFSRTILSRFDIFMIVMANPDGRKFVQSSYNYCWRGTSTGVDINRNFDWQFAKKGSSADPTDEEFRGPHPFSEPECKVYTDLTAAVKFDAFVSFHSGIRHIYLPFADTASKAMKRKPPNFDSLSQLAARLSTATKYKFLHGQAYNLNFYTADGTAFDYMAGVRQIPFSLAIEMWENKQHKGRSCFDEFNPSSEHLQAELQAFHPLYVELFGYLYQWKQEQRRPYTLLPIVIETPSLTLSFILLGLVVFISMIFGYKNRQYVCTKKRRVVYLRSLSSTFTVGGIFR